MKSIQARLRDGVKEATRIKGMSPRAVSIKAGHNQNQLTRFVSGSHDIKLDTLVDLCEIGLGIPFEEVLRMGTPR